MTEYSHKMCAHLPRQRCGRDADTGRNAAQYKTLTYSVPTAKIENISYVEVRNCC